ncbi:DUF1501 domain-containing protein [Telmatocola sphagniphila]|uniref:DUF1501 domain-containing protein n=1 Tax=Telmatocola sphagniphila TaxID=1123043 RepID=A0A8E6EV44_9BACT|nr:DUF1501 domain-containing protein [Telmatocola sphagniphila]QVL34474.1 DUF1501 domain-containing protein [Telmatocola sphagniphila]
MFRRDFLKTGSLLGLGSSLPAFLANSAYATPNAEKPGAKDTILVVVQFTGGNDGLNTVIPYADEEYAKLRPTLKIAKDRVKKLNDHVGLHPSMTGMAELYEEKSLCVVQGVGYPNPSQSHFRSMDIWQAASTAETLNEGWLGKALKELKAPSFHIANDGESSPLAFSGAPVRVPSVKNLEDFQLKMTAANGSEKEGQRKLLGEVSQGSSTAGNSNNLLQFVQRTALNTYASSDKLQEIGKNYQPKSPYPQSPLANKLRLCAQLIDGGLGTRIFYLSIDGFDTHANQGGANGAHANLLAQVSGAITAFYKDLSARGHKDRVLIMTFSEFGRRAKENGSKGTDHGSGAPMFLVGGKVNAGVLGDHPSLTQLEMGNLKHNLDFRQVYAAVLDQWLGVSSRKVLSGDFSAAKILV